MKQNSIRRTAQKKAIARTKKKTTSSPATSTMLSRPPSSRTSKSNHTPCPGITKPCPSPSVPVDGLLDDEAPVLAKLSLRSNTGPECGEMAEIEVLLIRLSLPRPLMPLLQFLYSPRKYSHIAFSHSSTTSPCEIFSNRAFSRRIVAMWNLFWCDFKLPSCVKCFPQSSSLHV